MTVTTMDVPRLPAGVIVCVECHDEGACKAHPRAKVACGRCMHTGLFVTGVENGKPVCPGGPCYRCQGKGFHVMADRRRNWGHSRNRRVYA